MIGIADADTSKSNRRRRPLQEQKFSSYLSFGHAVSVCLSIFLFIYVLVLLCASPLLQQEAPTDTHMAHGQVLKPVVSRLGKNIKFLPNAVIPGSLKIQLEKFRRKEGVMDSHLIDKAEQELTLLRKARQDSKASALHVEEALSDAGVNIQAGKRTGVFVLGMHRSGTSMLSGLLVTGLGYEVGSPLIGSKFDNKKGFFELIDAVLQNDEFMNLQDVWWSANVLNYDSEKALQAKKSGVANFRHGTRALAFLNNPDNSPWMQKDPRMCITLKTWLPLLKSQPAILWTYRHPMEVAHSLISREAAFTLDHTLRLWIAYNMRGIQNSAGLCRVYSSNDAVLSDPLNEVKRLSEELTSKCGVPAPPNELTEEQVSKFVDTTLQHGKKKIDAGLSIIDEHGDCKVYDLITETAVSTPLYELEKRLYLIAMKLFCDMGSGAAYEEFYEWPAMQ